MPIDMQADEIRAWHAAQARGDHNGETLISCATPQRCRDVTDAVRARGYTIGMTLSHVVLVRDLPPEEYRWVRSLEGVEAVGPNRRVTMC
jgi:hypothetical protein